MWKIWGGKCYLEISNLGGCRKFGVENAISNLEFGGWKIWGGKCYLESRIWGVENLGWKMLSRMSNLGGGKFGVESVISKFLIWGGGGKFGVENAVSKFLICEGGKFGVESAISNLEFGGRKIWGGKCYLESPIWVGGKFGAENAVSNLEFGV